MAKRITYNPGTIIGKLLFVEETIPKIYKNKKYRIGKFQCPFCKNLFQTIISEVKNRGTKGCRECSFSNRLPKFKREEDYDHKKQEYAIYHGIKARCYNKNSTSYYNYGARGIKMCDSWLGKGGFKNFFKSMGERPSKKHSIDRINCNQDYSPDNCRWATPKEQSKSIRYGVNRTFDLLKKLIMINPQSIETINEYKIWICDEIEKFKFIYEK